MEIFNQVTTPLCLAPMVGLTHRPFRRLINTYLPKEALTLWPTEMLNSRRLPGQKVGQTPETLKIENEKFLVPQILGNTEKYIAPSLKKLEDWGAHAIDINMGCPVQKALKHNYGVALMGDPSYAAKVVEMTRKNTELPISVKLRSGDKRDKKFLLQFVKGLESAGANWITLHPRLSSDQRKGKCDRSEIKFLKENLSIPVIGNGDIQTKDDVFSMLTETGCDMVMAGRVLTARPWLFSQIAKTQGHNISCPQTPKEEGREYILSLIKLLEYSLEDFSEDMALRKFRFHVKTSCVWLNFGHSVYGGVHKHKSSQSIKDYLLKLSENPYLEMSEKTDLRV